MIDHLSLWDRQLFLWLNSFHHPALDSLMAILSGQLIWIPMLLACLWIAYKQKGMRLAGMFTLFLLLALVASDVTSSYILKNLTERLRPCREEDLRLLIYSFGQKCGGKFGFVSSHAANSFALLTFSSISLPVVRRWWIIWVLGIFVSYSRIYLGVHYPGDVIGGILVGSLWGGVLGWSYLKIREPGAP